MNPEVCKSSLMWIQWKFFQKVVETYILAHFHPIFTYFRAQNGPKNRVSEGHILHTSKSNSNEYVKQDWCESSGNFWQISYKPEFSPVWGPKMARKLGPLGPNFYTP